MQRIRASISWPLSGSPGVMTLYTRSTRLENAATAALTNTRLYDAVQNLGLVMPTTLVFNGDSFVDDIDPDTGAITDSHSVTPWTYGGGSGTSYAPPASQVCVTWKTAAVIAGRRVRGRTFAGPFSLSKVDTDGSPTADLMTHMEAFAAAWVDNGLTDTFAVVWHRPVGGHGGTAEDITGHVIKDKLAVLRSRRD